MGSRRHTATLVVLLSSVAAYLFFCSFTFSVTPILLGGDQAYFWTYAMRILHGEAIYRDFFQFTPPGTDLLYALAFTLFGERLWVANAVVVLTGVALAALCFRLASGLVDDSLAALSAALFTVLVYGKALNATHHWFSIMAIAGAVAALSSASTGPRFLYAGVLLAIGSFFTQTHGMVAFVAFGLFAAWRRERESSPLRALVERLLLLSAGYAFSLLALSAYFIITVGPATLWSFQVAYPWAHMAHYSVRAALALDLEVGAGSVWARLPSLAPYLVVYTILPCVYAYVLLRCWRKRSESAFPNWNRLMLLCMVGLSLLLEVALNPNWFRVFGVALPGFALLGWVFEQDTRHRRVFVAVAWALVACLGVNHIRSMHQHYALPLELPAGKTVTDSIHREHLQWLSEHVTPGEFFFATNWPTYYLPLGVRSPVFLDVVNPSEQTRPEYVRRTITELDARNVEYTLWPHRLNDVTADTATARAIGELRTYLHDRYHLTHTFSDGEQVWQRR